MPRRVMQGTVVAYAKNKTVVVTVERQIMRPIYKKFMRRTKRYMAHDENNVCKSGEIVRIRECRPLGEGEYYHHDLIGLPCVSTDGAVLGHVVAVENFGAGDIIEIEKPPELGKQSKR